MVIRSEHQGRALVAYFCGLVQVEIDCGPSRLRLENTLEPVSRRRMIFHDALNSSTWYLYTEPAVCLLRDWLNLEYVSLNFENIGFRS